MHKMPPMINLAESCRDALAAPSSKANTFADCRASTMSQTVRNRSAAHCCTDINMDHYAFWQCGRFTAMLVQQRHVRKAYWQYCRDGLALTNHGILQISTGAQQNSWIARASVSPPSCSRTTSPCQLCWRNPLCSW